MSAALPNLANYREQPGFRWTENKPCDACKGSGILFNNSGPSGLHRTCDECSGSGLHFVEAE